MMRVLILADMGNIWTKMYIENALLPSGDEVTLYPLWGFDERFADFYKSNGVRVYNDGHKLPVIRNIPRLRLLVRNALNARDLAAMGPYDVIHAHYLVPKSLWIARALKRRFPEARLICTFWGSDLLRASDREVRSMARLMKDADIVTLQQPHMRRRLESAVGDALQSKLVTADFGISSIDALMRLSETKPECRARYGIPQETLAVALGYCAAESQAHIKALDELKAMPPEERARLTLVLQLNYGGSREGYADETEAAARALGCGVVALRDFMEVDEIVRLRRACDVFVMTSPTDAYSATLVEYLYAGCAVLLPEWLRYDELERLGMDTICYGDYSGLPAAISKLLAGMPSPDMEKRRLLEVNSWSVMRPKWRAMYERQLR